jgi:hypothetical protein
VQTAVHPEFPLVVSFYCGDAYYYRAAEKLKQDCVRLGVDHHVVEAPLPASVPWVTACRYKVRFIAECLRTHARPVLWVDADCSLLERPSLLNSCQADFAFFLRGFRYLKEYDPVALPRMAQPSILYFGHTPAALEFTALMCSLEGSHQGEATDDYFIQEAWSRFERPMSLLLMPPDLVCFELPARGRECFYFGRSGSATVFKGVAEQHVVDLYTPARRKAVLVREAGELLKAGRHSAARVLLRRAHELDPTDEALAYRIARQLRRDGKLKAALVFLRRFQGPASTVNHARRFAVDSAIEAKEIDRAEAITRDLAQRGSPSDAAWAQSRLLRIGLEQRAQKQRLKDDQRTALWWMESPYPGNLGDVLNPYIVEKLSGRPPRYAPRGKCVLAIGSTIKFATEETVVWGAGTPRMSDRLHAKAHYRAVRGPLTRELVLQSGGECPPVYGDPSCFLPRLYRPNRVIKRYEVGLVLHHSNEGEVRAGKGVKSISVLRGSYEDIERFIDELHECDRVLSTSLHGLIVAHAYGIPARWCEVPDSAAPLPGDGTKFRDYMLSVGLEHEPPLPLPRGTVVTADLASEANLLPRQQIDLDSLAAAAPFDVNARWRG